MKNLKRTGFITAAIFLMFLTACGGGGGDKGGGGGGGNGNGGGNTVSIDISPPDPVNGKIGEDRKFTVKVVTNHDNKDFTLSVDPEAGSGCNKIGNDVICTPTASGEYEVTVKAEADTTKSDTEKFTVSPLVEIYIDPSDEITEIVYGETATFTVKVENADNKNFTLSVAPEAGSGCKKIGNSVTCEPTAVGEYDITVTADEDKNAKAKIVLRVTESDKVGIGIDPPAASIKLEEFVTFTVTMNKTDFTLSFNPPNDHGCIEDRENKKVTCTPKKIGVYDITATATEDENEKATARITVFGPNTISSPPEIEIAGIWFSGMNRHGDMLIALYDSDNIPRAYLYDGVNYTPIKPDFAGDDADIYVYGINDNGDILGYYSNRESYYYEKGYFLFLKTESEYVKLRDYSDGSGAHNTYYTGLNNSRHLVGEFEDSNGYSQGFLYDYNNAAFSLIKPHPDATGCNSDDSKCGTTPKGVNNIGQIAGVYVNADGIYHSFVYDIGDDNFTDIK
ncbi:MAG: DUF3466 family protein, partial [Acidobacteriota bacterium]|nr:DUF3466 family protein [Acidobacteriota bacterium]